MESTPPPYEIRSFFGRCLWLAYTLQHGHLTRSPVTRSNKLRDVVQVGSCSLRTPRAIGPTGYSGAGVVQYSNATGALAPPGGGPGPGEAATVAQRKGLLLVGWLSFWVVRGPKNVLYWGLLRRSSSAVRRSIVVTSPVLGALLIQAGDVVTVHTSGQLGVQAPTRSFVPFYSRRMRRSQRARRCSRWRSPPAPAAGERSPGAGSPVEGDPPASHRGRVGLTNNKAEPVQSRTDSQQLSFALLAVSV